MTKPKTLDQLRAEKERAETQLAQEQHKLERLENRKKYLEKGERTKRIITYGRDSPCQSLFLLCTIGHNRNFLKFIRCFF